MQSFFLLGKRYIGQCGLYVLAMQGGRVMTSF